MPGILAYIKFKVKETGEDLVIATTRPELLCACQAVIVHPDDERYKHLHGKHAIIPLYNREVPIIPHKLADPNFGTGAMMVCSFGDWRDVQLFRELGLKPVKAIDEGGRMTECAGPVAGLKVQEAKKKIVEILKENGYLVKVENITHKVPVHERCETPIEIIPMKEYYLKQLEFKDVLKKYAEEMKWQPERYKKNLLQWIDSVTMDWPISRRRFYATEIPIWTCKKCGYKYVPPPGKYYRPWKENPPVERCPKCGANEWEGETRVFDTWMDSSVTVLYITKFMRDNDFWRKTFVEGKKLRPQGYDIIRTWLYYSLLRVHQLTNMRAFDYVFINGMGLDQKGRKMSKRYGNVIMPEEVLDKYGADATRFWIALEVKPGENYRVIENKIKGAQKFLTKFLNVARYVSSFPQPEEAPKLSGADKWILAELAELLEKARKAYSEMDFHTVAEEFYHFVWDKFSSHYIELSKKRARMMDERFSEEEAKAAWWTLHQVLKNLLLVLAPISPAISDYIWRQLYSEESVHAQRLPEPPEEWKDEEALRKGREVMELNSKVWKAKKEVLGKKLRDEVSEEELKSAGVELPELGDFEKDFVALHNIRG
jgi:valyl-tRNA synthetase